MKRERETGIKRGGQRRFTDSMLMFDQRRKKSNHVVRYRQIFRLSIVSVVDTTTSTERGSKTYMIYGQKYRGQE